MKQMGFQTSLWQENSGPGQLFSSGSVIELHQKDVPDWREIIGPLNYFDVGLSGFQQSLWRDDGGGRSRDISLHIPDPTERREMARNQIIGPWNSFDTWLDDFIHHLRRDTILNVAKVGGIILLYYLAPGVLTWIENTFGID